MLQNRFKFRVMSIKPSDTVGFNAQLISEPSIEMLEANAAAAEHIKAAYIKSHPNFKVGVDRIPSFMVVNGSGKSFTQIKTALIKELTAALQVGEEYSAVLMNTSGIIVEAVATAYNPGDAVVDLFGQPVIDRLTGKPVVANDAHVNMSFASIDVSGLTSNPIADRAIDKALANPLPIEKVWGEVALTKNQQAKFVGAGNANSATFGSAPAGSIPASAVPAE